ncbi:hypothetical protein AI29_14500 [bacteria symbiont BFo2 of Frankliniella occidentalis]|nr:hypothetical protein AI29_14500 [bacteria symbiont BFo2 of Frankliniella occidentalis]KYP94678.1 hypothetical protein WB67_09735 [bacteria symbiont BFo2 of Frankliniella occidentalis]
MITTHLLGAFSWCFLELFTNSKNHMALPSLDEFLNIKNVSRDDMLGAHRVPPQMMGIMPNNAGGFGDVEKASRVFVRNELLPLQTGFEELNEWMGEEIIQLLTYSLQENAESEI